jgi:hypothetical protein
MRAWLKMSSPEELVELDAEAAGDMKRVLYSP